MKYSLYHDVHSSICITVVVVVGGRAAAPWWTVKWVRVGEMFGHLKCLASGYPE